MADIVNIHEAKTHLSRLLAKVRRGATVTIASAGEPVARLVPFGKGPGARSHSGQRGASGSAAQDRESRLRRFLEQEVWSELAGGEAGRRLTREEEDRILGYGTSGA